MTGRRDVCVRRDAETQRRRDTETQAHTHTRTHAHTHTDTQTHARAGTQTQTQTRAHRQSDGTHVQSAELRLIRVLSALYSERSSPPALSSQPIAIEL